MARRSALLHVLAAAAGLSFVGASALALCYADRDAKCSAMVSGLILRGCVHGTGCDATMPGVPVCCDEPVDDPGISNYGIANNGEDGCDGLVSTNCSMTYWRYICINGSCSPTTSNPISGTGSYTIPCGTYCAGGQGGS